MSNIIPIAQGFPAYLQQAQYTPNSLGAGIAASPPRLGITITREFTLTKNGVTQILPARSIRAVILAAAETLNKAWFAKAYVPGTDAPPDCFSDDGQMPSPLAENKQASQCSLCKKNAFGSHPVTGRGKACGDRKRIVLALEDDPNTPVVSNFPTMSLPGLKNIAAQLEQGRIPMQALLVEFSFDMTVQYSKLLVNPVGFVTQEMFVQLESLANLTSTKELLHSHDFDPTEEAPAQPALQAPAYLQQYGQQPAAAVEQAPVAVAQPAVAATAPQPTAEQIAAFLAAQQAQAAPTVAAEVPPVSVGAATAAVTAEVPKRKRRTKAEMEAARAAEAAAVAQATPAPVQPAVQAPVAAAQPAAVAQPTPEQIAAFLASQQAQVMPVQQAVQGELLPAAAAVQASPATVTPPPAQAAANVMDMINRWKSNS